MNNIPHWLVSLSIFVNHLTCGPIGFSLCARFYDGKRKGYKLHSLMATVSDAIFFWDKDHCRKAWHMRNK